MEKYESAYNYNSNKINVNVCGFPDIKLDVVLDFSDVIVKDALVENSSRKKRTN
jgi:hypothetical protein